MSVQGSSATASERPSEWDPFWTRTLRNAAFNDRLVKLTVREQHEERELLVHIREIGDVRVWVRVEGHRATEMLGYRYDQIRAVEAV